MTDGDEKNIHVTELQQNVFTKRVNVAQFV